MQIYLQEQSTQGCKTINRRGVSTDMMWLGDQAMNGLRLALTRCPLCGDHGVVGIYYRGGPRVLCSIWGQKEALELHQRLLADGGDYQLGFMGELEVADYLREDGFQDELNWTGGFLLSLGVQPACKIAAMVRMH